MMFGRELRTKLPDYVPTKVFRKNALETVTGVGSLQAKCMLKGDVMLLTTQWLLETVLVKNTKLAGELAPKFEPKPNIVQTKEGKELTLKSSDGVVQ